MAQLSFRRPVETRRGVASRTKEDGGLKDSLVRLLQSPLDTAGAADIVDHVLLVSRLYDPGIKNGSTGCFRDISRKRRLYLN